MKFKILKGTETFEKLTALYKRMLKADRARNPILDELGSKRFAPVRGLAGGILAVEFGKPPAGWKRIGKPWQNLYEPTVKNKEMIAKLKALPVLKYDELNAIVGFKEVDHMDDEAGTWTRIRCPGVRWKKEVILMDTGRAKYTPPNADIIEILESEYVRLSEEKRKKETA